MRDHIIPSFLGIVLLTVGGTLLEMSFANSHSDVTASLIAGAAFISCGLVALWASSKNWWDEKRQQGRQQIGRATDGGSGIEPDVLPDPAVPAQQQQ